MIMMIMMSLNPRPKKFLLSGSITQLREKQALFFEMRFRRKSCSYDVNISREILASKHNSVAHAYVHFSSTSVELQSDHGPKAWKCGERRAKLRASLAYWSRKNQTHRCLQMSRISDPTTPMFPALSSTAAAAAADASILFYDSLELVMDL
jgi:hypothetical protein